MQKIISCAGAIAFAAMSASAVAAQNPTRRPEPAAARVVAPSAKNTARQTTLTADQIVSNMEGANAPGRARTSRGLLVHQLKNAEAQFWRFASVTRTVADAVQILRVFDTGTALLAGYENEAGDPVEWMYLSAEERAREIAPVFADDPFLGTDLTNSDVGIAPPGPRTFKLLGRADIDHRAAYKIEERRQGGSEFGRIVIWVAADDWMPMKREYFDRADRLWKVAEYQDLVIDGVPTMTAIDLKDVQSGSETQYVLHEIRYDERVTDDYFRPGRLGQTVKNFEW